MPGHDALSRFVAAVSGGPRGCRQRSNTLVTIIRPPQHGHGGRISFGSSAASSAGGGTAFRRSRARAMLISDADIISRPELITRAVGAVSLVWLPPRL